MSTRDMAMNIVNLMNEDQLTSFVNLFKNGVSDVPNDETIAAMKETEEMLSNPETQIFDSVDDLFSELRS